MSKPKISVDKKVFQVKISSLTRTLREYFSYKDEVEEYDMSLVQTDKKQREFFEQSKQTLLQVSAKVIEFYHLLNGYVAEHKDVLEELEDALEDAQARMQEVRILFPAMC